jgi:hypothetical protein
MLRLRREVQPALREAHGSFIADSICNKVPVPELPLDGMRIVSGLRATRRELPPNRRSSPSAYRTGNDQPQRRGARGFCFPICLGPGITNRSQSLVASSRPTRSRMIPRKSIFQPPRPRQLGAPTLGSSPLFSESRLHRACSASRLMKETGRLFAPAAASRVGPRQRGNGNGGANATSRNRPAAFQIPSAPKPPCPLFRGPTRAGPGDLLVGGWVYIQWTV